MTIEQYMSKVSAEANAETSVPNGIKISATNNPLSVSVANTEQVGSSEIVAMCSNAIAVGIGQTGDAPLYVFCKDGIYALFVDTSGKIAYTNARVVARDVCNNPKSVTPIDNGVVFSTDRGLMMIAGSEVEEIGQPLEGNYDEYTKEKILKNAYTVDELAGLEESSVVQTNFLEFLKDAIIAYNHNERELMLCNLFKKTVAGRLYSKYDYMYVLDRNGNWTRRDYTADEFVENFPSTFRLTDGQLIQLDESSDSDNGIFALSNVLKLDSIGFKSINRVVARGVYDTMNIAFPYHKEYANYIYGQDYEKNFPRTFFSQTVNVPSVGSVHIKYSDFSLFFSENDEKDEPIYLVVYKVTNNSKSVVRTEMVGTISAMDGVVRYEHIDLRLSNLQPGDYEIALEYRLYLYGDSIIKWDADDNLIITVHCENTVKPYLGLYVFGSYDGRKWACIGHKEKQGNFTDIGCNVERTDCKFFRIALAGQVTKDSRLDYFEVSAKQSRLSTKIR